MTDHAFVDVSGAPLSATPDFWEPVIFRRAEIDAEIARLADQPAPANGRREARLVHHRATEPGLGLAPGIAVTLSVLKPGEATRPLRHNSTVVGFGIGGAGRVVIDGRPIDFAQHDTWNIPSYRTYRYENPTDELQVRLSYSNSPTLEKLHVHLVEDDPADDPVVGPTASAQTPAEPATPELENPFGTLELAGGAALMPYETLISPPPVASRALHWPWTEVKERLDRLDALGADYVGRRLYLLYNPSTGRTNGITPSFFATVTIRPPGIVDKPHRHVSAAINYFFHGSGWSTVDGRRYEWEAGDLMLTAPGWAVHHHASDEGDRVYELTIQDQPYHLALESLLWQERMDRPPRLLGVESGFDTNRDRPGPAAGKLAG